MSATIGDMPLEGETVRAAVLATAALGVDYVKLGLFPGGDPESCLRVLSPLTAEIRLVLVVFADALPEIDAIEAAARIGAFGVMVDTCGKDGLSLPDLFPPAKLAAFVAAARRQGLTVGVAGSLRASHVPGLLTLGPDLLGFRGALCRDGSRVQPLDRVRLAGIRALIPSCRGIKREANLADLSQAALC